MRNFKNLITNKFFKKFNYQHLSIDLKKIIDKHYRNIVKAKVIFLISILLTKFIKKKSNNNKNFKLFTNFMINIFIDD